MQGTLPEPALGDRCRQHPLFHWWVGGGRFQKRRRRKKDCRRSQGLPLFLYSAPNPKLSVSTNPQRETEKWGWGERDGGGKSKKIAKVNGLELEAASATAV